MDAYSHLDANFTNFLITNIENHLNQKNFHTLIDFGCAFAAKTRKIKHHFNINYFIGIETNIWIRFWEFKKQNQSDSFFVKRNMKLAVNFHEKLNKGKPILFIANSSMMYLSPSEKQKVLRLIPNGSLILVTEPKSESDTNIFEQVGLKVIEVKSIPPDVYNPGTSAELLIAEK